MRELNETEKRVLATARNIEAERGGLWGGPSIQFKGWPEVKGYRSKELGITDAIKTLVRRGMVKRYPHRAGYHTITNINAECSRKEREMNYKKVIEDYNNGTIDREKVALVMDNDGGYWSCLDDSLSDDQMELLEEQLEDKYGTPKGYSDIVDVLIASGVNAEWC